MNGSQMQSPMKSAMLNVDWEFGAENQDDDFHTDIVFLRAATEGIFPYAGTVHRYALSYFDGFNGEFYFSANETKRICASLITKLISDAEWCQRLNETIRAKCAALLDVFDPVSNLLNFSSFSNEDLLSLYLKQHSAHSDLCSVAWIPEILQVEPYGLTSYLSNILAENGLSGEKLNQAFLQLTAVPALSEYMQEEMYLRDIALSACRCNATRNAFFEPTKLARLSIPGNILRTLREVQSKYGYLSYHGFGSRNLTTIKTYIERIRGHINSIESGVNHEQIPTNADFSVTKSDLSFIDNRLSHGQRRLFAAYGDFGHLKAFRRLAELKNFFFLDRIITELAIRFEVPEKWLRFMTPEEITKLLQNREPFSEGIVWRATRMLYYAQDEQEAIWTDDWITDFINSIRPHANRTEDLTLECIHGRPACAGTAFGSARILGRVEDAKAAGFVAGDVIVSVEADPDLFPLIRLASAVVTDQGGITCHVATIARELNIPCVTGTQVATRVIQNGDSLSVDATNGTVFIVDRHSKRQCPN